MTENFKNKIQRLELENFTCFSKATFDFSSGINVFIGENGTGKTHVLKILYSIAKHEDFIERDLEGIFKVHFSNLIRQDTSNSNINFEFSNNKKMSFDIQWQFHEGTVRDDEGIEHIEVIEIFQVEPSGFNKELDEIKDTLFIPCTEMLSLYNGFIAAYEKRENGFDRTYYHLAKALNANLLINGAANDAALLWKGLEDDLGVRVRYIDGKFSIFFKKEKKLIPSAITAEGLKKLGQLTYLIQNGSLTKDTILFWDEPETNLNPRYIKIVAKFLQTLAKNGVQIFVATHDYLLVHLLSLDAEYQQVTDAPPMRFFALTKGENGTEVESADTIAGITNNALLDEYSAYSELEHQLFKQSMQMV